MIYLIDDKRSRQEQNGWDADRLAQYSNYITPIYNLSDLNKYRAEIIEKDNVVLCHESFPDFDDTQALNSFKKELKQHETELYVCYFSGSKVGRYVQENICGLTPEVLYAHLEIFINYVKENSIDFNYLAFGENYKIEQAIYQKLIDVNDNNVDYDKITIPENLCFIVDQISERAVDPLFENIDKKKHFFSDTILDEELDTIIVSWFEETKYDAIYIPLYFGNVLSDYLGLRLAMHIRLTETPNQQTPIFIYGVSSFEDLCQNECFDVFKFSSTFLIGADNDSLNHSLQKLRQLQLVPNFIQNEIDRIKINIPSNIGDNHSVANKWAIYRWCDMLNWNGAVPVELDNEFTKSIYFKYLVTKYGKHDKIRTKDKNSIKIEGITGKTIAYIDDEYDKGWEQILRTIIEHNGAKLVCFKGFDKKLSKEDLLEKIYSFINERDDIDCYLLDLRLHEDDFKSAQDLTGHKVARKIKEINKGNQIIIFTASNKIWNLKEEINKIGAIAYVLKESPEYNFKKKESLGRYEELKSGLKIACSLSYLKDFVKKQKELKKIYTPIVQLDSIVDLLVIGRGNSNEEKYNQDIMNLIVLMMIVFIEDLIKNELKYELLSLGTNTTTRIELCDSKDLQRIITGHIFFKRDESSPKKPIVQVSQYFDQPREPECGWVHVKNKDITLVVSTLLMVFNLSQNTVQEYVTLKYIRNTQIAHKDADVTSNKQIITKTKVIEFYNNVIYPTIKYSFGNNTI